MRRKSYLGSISVDVEIGDVLDEISDGAILEEMESRSLARSENYDRDYAMRAFEALRMRRYAEAEALLDRALWPHPATTKEALSAMASLFDRAVIPTSA